LRINNKPEISDREIPHPDKSGRGISTQKAGSEQKLFLSNPATFLFSGYKLISLHFYLAG